MVRLRSARVEGGSIDRYFQVSVFGMLASGYLAVAASGRLAFPALVLTAAVLAVRFLVIAGLVRPPLPERWVTPVTVAYILFYPVDYFLVSGGFLPATVHLVLFLASVKVLTAQTDRDHIQVLLIAFLEMLAGALLSGGLSFFFFLVLFLLSMISALAAWEIRRSLRAPAKLALGAGQIAWRLGPVSVFMGLGVLVLSAGLFFVLPRTARAAFGHLVPEQFRLPGLSDEVTLGEIGEIKQRSTVLMHVRIPGVESVAGLKWRGNALADFDGRSWSNRNRPGETLRVRGRMLTLADDYQRRRQGRRLSYEVQLKPLASDLLFIAGRPEFVRIDSPLIFRTREGGYRLGFRAADVLRYGVYAFFEDGESEAPIQAERLGAEERGRYLDVPSLDARVSELAHRLASPYSSPAEQAAAIGSYLARQYGYTLELPDERETDPIADFLFERREGHCEYFASAMAVMLRQVGIPSRVATGFQGGVHNPISGWHVVRASDAHSWVEAWLPGAGWTTFDPTPAGPSTASMGLWTHLTLVADAAQVFWQDWVLDYDLNRQLSLAARMEESRRTLSLDWAEDVKHYWSRYRELAAGWLRHNGGRLLAGLAVLAMLALATPRLVAWIKGYRHSSRVERGEAEAADAVILYARALALLRRRGIEKQPWLTPLEFAREAPGDAVRRVLGELATAHNELRYGGRKHAATRMLILLEELESAAAEL